MPAKTIITVLFSAVITCSIAQKSLKNVRAISATKGIGNLVYFAASDDTYGEELWVSDGTSEGTKLIKDINAGYAGSSPQRLTSFNGNLFFSAYSPEFQNELWKSDGTPGGTVMVKDIAPSGDYYGGSNPTALTVLKDRLYFTTSQGGLYKTDGTAAGTKLVDEVVDGFIRNVTVSGNFLYYYKGLNDTDLNRTDGTTLSKISLPTDTDETYFYALYTAGPNLYAIRANNQVTKLFLYNKNTNNWPILKTFPAPLYGQQFNGNFTAIGDKLYFSFRTNYPNLSPTDELWVTDGTAVGTIMLKSFEWSPYESGSEMDNFIPFQGNLIFQKQQV